MNESQIKDVIRERDGHCCAKCGMPNATHFHHYGKSLDVHRVVPGSEYSLEPGVCLTLCKICHGPKPKSPPGTHTNKQWFVRLADFTREQCRAARVLAALQQISTTAWIRGVVLKAIEDGKETVDRHFAEG